MKYRTLTLGEIIREGDQHLICDEWSEVSGAIGRALLPSHAPIRRPVKEHNWISFKDRKPTYLDANEHGKIAARYKSGEYHFVGWNGLNHFEYWMPLNFISDEPPRIKVRNEDVIPSKDGSVKVGCTTIPADDMKEIIRQRELAMK